MARKRRFRFGLSIVFAGRPPVGGAGLGCQAIRFAAAARFGALGSVCVLPDGVLSDSKSPRRSFRRGLNSCDDEDMPVICSTCQNVFAGSLKRPDHATLHGVVFDIFVERPIRPNLIATRRRSRLPLCPRIRYGCGAFLIHCRQGHLNVSEAEIRAGSEYPRL
jgi:hypothetical protein